MNYHQYYPVDVVNGPGTRCTLFVSGCVHQCRGCYNQSTQRLDSGVPFTQEAEDKIIAVAFGKARQTGMPGERHLGLDGIHP